MTNQDLLQEEVINKTLEFYKTNSKGYLDLAMRSGKTRITIECLKSIIPDESYHLLIAYPDNKLKDVWKNENIKWQFNHPYITYINFSSLKLIQNLGFYFCVFDEFHALSLQEQEYAEKIINNSSYSLFLSGTVSKETKMKWPKFKEIFKFTTLQAIDFGVVADYQITVHVVDLDNTIKTPNKKGKLQSEKEKYKAYSYVMSNFQDKKSKAFMHLALARNRLSLSSIGKMNYLRSLLDKMKDKRVLVFTGLADVADNIGIASYHSKSEYPEYFMGFQDGLINHLALAAMGKVGVTYLNLDSVILMNFTYNAAETSQILNRAIKLDYKGKIADLHVICLNEEPELKKVQESLSMLDKNRIKYI